MSLDKPVTLEELELVIKGMNNGATPGVDELLVEFYWACWPQLKSAKTSLMKL